MDDLDCYRLPFELVATSATFWNASRNAATATIDDLKHARKRTINQVSVTRQVTHEEVVIESSRNLCRSIGDWSSGDKCLSLYWVAHYLREEWSFVVLVTSSSKTGTPSYNSQFQNPLAKIYSALTSLIWTLFHIQLTGVTHLLKSEMRILATHTSHEN